MGHGGKFTQKPISLHGWTAGDKMHPGLVGVVFNLITEPSLSQWGLWLKAPLRVIWCHF